MRTRNSLVMILIWLLMFSVWASNAFGDIVWHIANQATIAWDEVKTIIVDDGTSVDLPAGDEVRYRVYVATNKESPVLQTTEPITAMQYTVTLSGEGKYIVGVRSVRYGGEPLVEVSQSVIAWSDDPSVVQGDTFGFKKYYLPSSTMGVRPHSQ